MSTTFSRFFGWLALTAALVAGGSARAALSDSCVANLAKMSQYGGGWIAKSEVDKAVLQSGQPVTYYHAYTCVNCGRESSMRPNTQEGHTTCVGCGKPHSGETTYQKTIDGVAVVHKDDLVGEKDKAKEKSIQELRWKCTNCGITVPAAVKSCPGCGGAKAKPTVIQEKQATEITQPDGRNDLPEVPSITAARERERTGITPPRPREAAPEPPAKKERFWTRGKLAAAGGGAALLVGGLATWAFSTKNFTGTVTGGSWEHAIDVQEFRETDKENWCSDIHESAPILPMHGGGESPGAWEVRNAGSRVHHYDHVFDHTETYTEQVPYTDTETYSDTETVSNGNGTSTTRPVTRTRSVTRYRTESRTRDIYRDDPVYHDWCRYRTYDWFTVRTARTGGSFPKSGAGPLPEPEVTLGTLERQLPVKRRYSVEFTYERNGKSETYVEKPEDESAFRQWSANEKVIVTRNNLGSIRGVRKAP